MKAIVIHGYGGPEMLRWEDFPLPVVARGEVLVRVAAAGINPIDVKERQGLLRERRPVTFPAVLGWDVAGTIVEIGDEVDGLKLNNRVFGWAYHSYAELCVVRADLLALVPEGMNLIDAAAVPLPAAAGKGLVKSAGVRSGQRVLISGAFGAVGRCAVFASRDQGARVIAGVTRRQLEHAESIGADEVIALDDGAASAAIEPVDLVLNCVGGAAADDLLGKVRPGGVFASVTGRPATADAHPDVEIVSFVSQPDPESYRSIAKAIVAGAMTIPIDRRMALADAAAAHAAVERGGAGKILLIP